MFLCPGLIVGETLSKKLFEALPDKVVAVPSWWSANGCLCRGSHWTHYWAASAFKNPPLSATIIGDTLEFGVRHDPVNTFQLAG